MSIIISIQKLEGVLPILNRRSIVVGFTQLDRDNIEKYANVSLRLGGLKRNRYATLHVDGHKCLLHRLITNAPKDKQVDHANRDTFDNRRTNLRICTHAENNRNHKKLSNNTSGAIGVRWDRGRWTAEVMVNHKAYRLGRFDSFDDAVAARDRVALTLHGEYAVTNAEQAA